MSMSGPLAAIGRQIMGGVNLYMEQHGSTVAGKKIEIVLRDDTASPDVAKRLAQELIVNEKVNILGVGITPVAMAIAPLATESKTPTVILVSGTSVVTDRSPLYVRASFTLGQQSKIIADWALKNGSKKTVIIQSDWAPGHEATAVFTEIYTKGGGQILETIKIPLANPDFAPFLQRARATPLPTPCLCSCRPDKPAPLRGSSSSVASTNPASSSIGPGDVTDDNDLNGMGDAMLGVVTAGFYSASHPSAMNKAYVAAFKKANNGLRPNFISVGGYDAMHLIYEALKKTGGKTDGEPLINAMKGMKWESPRGPVSIDPATREIVQNVYIRKVERVDGELYNTEIATFEAVKDPGHEKK